MSPTESVILNTVNHTFKVRDAAKACGQTSSSASTTLRRMAGKGLIEKTGRGTYKITRG